MSLQQNMKLEEWKNKKIKQKPTSVRNPKNSTTFHKVRLVSEVPADYVARISGTLNFERGVEEQMNYGWRKRWKDENDEPIYMKQNEGEQWEYKADEMSWEVNYKDTNN